VPPIVSEEYKRNKKKEILASALRCFARKGFQAASIDDIVAESGISKGAIYNYFKSKDDIYITLMMEQTEEANDRLLKEIEALDSAGARLSYLFDRYSRSRPDKDKKDYIVVHYEFTLHSSRNEEISRVLKQRGNQFFINLILKIVEEGKESGEFAAETDSRLIANMFWVVVDGTNIQRILFEDFPSEKVFLTFKQFMMSYIKNG
jgi:AcrR family transcriptional regulator